MILPERPDKDACGFSWVTLRVDQFELEDAAGGVITGGDADVQPGWAAGVCVGSGVGGDCVCGESG